MEKNPFVVTRQQHEQELVEDYTELIYELIKTQGEARVGELAKRLGVSHVSVVRVLKRLQSEGYVQTAPHKPILLTKKGEVIAKSSKKRHELIVKFLIAIGVPDKVAEIDAEGIEHHVSKETLAAFSAHINRKS